MTDSRRDLLDGYDSYVGGYRDADGNLPEMMQLKYVHTMEVVRNAGIIAEGEGFSAEEAEAAYAAALLHDVGRYEQLKRYNTFRDSESVDHAVFSHDIAAANGWLDEFYPGEGLAPARWRKAVLDAVLYHNRRDVPEGLDRLTALLSHTVRDADKLDIFRVLEEQVRVKDWRHDARAFWNLRTDLPADPAVVAAIEEGRPVDYGLIRSLSDFVLIQVGWMRNGLHFAVSRRLCRERGHLEFRRAFLRELGAGSAAERLCNLGY